MTPTLRLPTLVKGSEIPNVECEDGSPFLSGKSQLFLIRGPVLSRFFRAEDIETLGPQIDSQASHDVAIKVEPNEKRFKAG